MATPEQLRRITDAINAFRERRLSEASLSDSFASVLQGMASSFGVTEIPGDEVRAEGLLRNLRRKATTEDAQALLDDLVSQARQELGESPSIDVEAYLSENLFNFTARKPLNEPSLFTQEENVLNDIISVREQEVDALPTAITTRERFIATVQALDDLGIIPDALGDIVQKRRRPASQQELVEAAAFSEQLMQRIPQITREAVRAPGGGGDFRQAVFRALDDIPVTEWITGSDRVPAIPSNFQQRLRQEIIAAQPDKRRSSKEVIERLLRDSGVQTSGLGPRQKAMDDIISSLSGQMDVLMTQLESALQGLTPQEINSIADTLGSGLIADAGDIQQQIAMQESRQESADDLSRFAGRGGARQFVKDSLLREGLPEEAVSPQLLERIAISIEQSARAAIKAGEPALGLQSLDNVFNALVPDILLDIEQNIRARAAQEQAEFQQEQAGRAMTSQAQQSLQRALQAISPAQRATDIGGMTRRRVAAGIQQDVAERAAQEVRAELQRGVAPDVESIVQRLLRNPQQFGRIATDIPGSAAFEARFASLPPGPGGVPVLRGIQSGTQPITGAEASNIIQSLSGGDTDIERALLLAAPQALRQARERAQSIQGEFAEGRRDRERLRGAGVSGARALSTGMGPSVSISDFFTRNLESAREEFEQTPARVQRRETERRRILRRPSGTAIVRRI